MTDNNQSNKGQEQQVSGIANAEQTIEQAAPQVQEAVAEVQEAPKTEGTPAADTTAAN